MGKCSELWYCNNKWCSCDAWYKTCNVRLALGNWNGLRKKKKRERICEMETAVLLVEEEAVKKWEGLLCELFTVQFVINMFMYLKVDHLWGVMDLQIMFHVFFIGCGKMLLLLFSFYPSIWINSDSFAIVSHTHFTIHWLISCIILFTT